MLKSKVVLIVLSTLAAACAVTALVAIPFTSIVDKGHVEVQTYDVIFESNGGSSVNTQVVNANELVTRPADPTRRGYVFKGWYSDSSLNTPFNFETERINENKTLYAKWEEEPDLPLVPKYTITFDSNGQEIEVPKAMENQESITELPVLNDTAHYHFKGWYLDAKCETLAVVGTVLDKDLVLYAKWVEVFTVVFTTGESGVTVPSQEVEKGECASEPKAPEVQGKEFEYWATKSGEKFDFATPITKETLLIAKWKNEELVVTHLVTFKLAGGAGKVPTMDPQKEGSSITLPAGTGLTRKGYKFVGWTSNNTDYKAGDTFKVQADDVVFTAKWEAETYTITYDLDGGNLASEESNPTSYTVETETITLKNPTKDGFKFDGWYEGETKVESIVKGTTGNKTLVAKWAKLYTVTFELDGGEGKTPTLPNSIAGTTITLPSDEGLSKQNMHFAGWLCSADNKVYQAKASYTMPAQAVTFTAQWAAEKPAEYTVTFELDGGEGKTPTLPNSIAGATITLPSDEGLSKQNMHFAGWLCSADNKVYQAKASYTMPAKAVTFTAQWSVDAPTTYEVTFDSVDGTYIEKQTITANGVVEEPAAPTKNGYIFLYWQDEAKQKYDFKTPVTKNMTLTAVYRARTIYDDLAESQDKILNDDFDSYSATDKIPQHESWGTKGIYYELSSKVVDASKLGIVLGGGNAVLRDDNDAGSIHFTVDYGTITSGTVEGYLETTFVEPGGSWTFFQLYGKNAASVGIEEIFGIRVDKDNILKYRITSAGTVTQPSGVSIPSANNNTYKIHYKINLATGCITVEIGVNDGAMQAFVTDLDIKATEVIGFKLVTSDNGAKRQIADYVAVTNMNLTLNQYIDRVKANLNTVYSEYDVENKLAAIKTDMEGILNAGLTDLEGLKASDATTALNATNKKSVDDKYAAVVKQLADKALAEQLKVLAAELDTYKDKSLYTKEYNKTLLENALATWKPQILAASSYDAGLALQGQAKADLDKIPTDADIQDDPTVVVYTITFETAIGTAPEALKDQHTMPAKTSLPTLDDTTTQQFKGWKVKDTNAEPAYGVALEGDVILVADWGEFEKFEVTYAINGYGTEVAPITTHRLTQADLPALTDDTMVLDGWYYEPTFVTKAKAGDVITQPTELYANWIKQGSIKITEFSGHLESAYLEWEKVAGVTDYNVYVKKQSDPDTAYKAIDKPLIREYADHYRADAVGLAAGNYTLKVETVSSTASSATRDVTVLAHDRSGYAFDPKSTHKDASGAYNADGTLKAGAQVIYVTAKTAKTVTATIGGATVTGFQSILDAKQKKGNTDILNIRIVGTVTKNDLDKISSSSEGLQIKGADTYQNMYLTIEGIGEDATINGFGILIRNCGNVELRNFGIVNFMDDGISIDTDNRNLWVHNLDIFYGSAGGDTDQAKGDGSLDCKKSQYCTFSYNHFWDSGKCCLLDAGAGNGSDFITYHHNWFDHSDSRHPRVRNAGHVHVYNNYYDGNSKYGVGSTTGSSTFVEANYFRNCKNPMMISLQGSDALGDGTFSGEIGGMIKAFGNYIVGAASYIPYSKDQAQFDCYDVTTRDELVPESVKNTSGKTYNNFDTASDFYSYNVDTAEEAKAKVEKYAGRINGGDLKWDFNDAVEDSNYSIIPELKAAVTNYKTTVVRILGEGAGSSTPEVKEYTVSFEVNGGSSVSSQTIKEGGKATKPENPKKDKNIFDGWFTDNALTKEYNFDSAVNTDVTLYAKWTEIPTGDPSVQYTVTFDSQQGSAVPAQTVNSGAYASEPTAPTRDGYTFGGWYKEAACTTAYVFTTPVTGNITLYAKWTEGTAPTVISWDLSTEALSGSKGTTQSGIEYSVNGADTSGLRLRMDRDHYIQATGLNASTATLTVTAKMKDIDTDTEFRVVITYSDGSTEEKPITVVKSSSNPTEVSVQITAASGKTIKTISFACPTGATKTKSAYVSAFKVEYQ